MARIITKDDEAHPTHPAYKKAHADVVAAEKALNAEKEKVSAAKFESPKVVEPLKEEKPAVKVPERKTETKTE